MANVLFTRTSDPNSKPVTDGQLIFDTSGNGKMYLDNGTNRLEMGGALTVDATLSKTSTNPVQNKAVAGVMLDTLSDIGNVTSKGFLTDALAVKELNTNVNELNNSLTWKFLGSINGNDEINIPENATELSYTINGVSGFNLSGIIHLNQYSKLSSLEVGSVWMVTDGGNYGFGGNISLANGKYKINEMWNNYTRTNITNSCISHIYYR